MMTDEILEKTLSDLGMTLDELHDVTGRALMLDAGETIKVALGPREVYIDNKLRFFRETDGRSQVYFSLTRMISSYLQI